MSSTTQQNDKPPTVTEIANGAAINFEKPKWLTAQLFEKLLKDIIPNYRKTKHFDAKPALAPGENFATVMLRVNIEVELEDGTTNSLSYMLKLPQENEQFKEVMRKRNIFEIEFRMYHEFVPEFQKLYRDAGLEANFSAKCYNIKTPSEFGVILLEDLQPFGYKNVNRLEGLDLAHSKAVLERLAQWHAASAVRVETKGMYPDLFTRGMFHKSQRETMNHYRNGIKTPFLAAAKTFKGSEHYYDKLVSTVDTMIEQLAETTDYDSNEFNVLNHGDCWSNNFMFKYDANGKIDDTLLIDYQMINYGSPARDLHYFLMSSTSYDLKVHNFDFFIKYYHDNLVKNLKLLKYPKKLPTLKELHIAMIKYGIWGLVSTLGVMAVALLDSNSDANMDGFFNESDAAVRFRNAMFTNSRFRKHAEMLLPWMHNRGVLENWCSK